MIGLTPQQSELLRFLRARGENSPSFDEMREYMGLASKSGIHRILVGLEERGYVRRHFRRNRAIELLDPVSDLRGVSTEALLAEIASRGGITIGVVA